MGQGWPLRARKERLFVFLTVWMASSWKRYLLRRFIILPTRPISSSSLLPNNLNSWEEEQTKQRYTVWHSTQTALLCAYLLTKEPFIYPFSFSWSLPSSLPFLPPFSCLLSLCGYFFYNNYIFGLANPQQFAQDRSNNINRQSSFSFMKGKKEKIKQDK